DLVARAQIDDGIARQLPVFVAFVAPEELARYRDEVAAHPPLRKDPIVEAELETVLRNARYVVAGLYVGAIDRLAPHFSGAAATGDPDGRVGRGNLERVEKGGVHERVGRVREEPVRAVLDGRLD